MNRKTGPILFAALILVLISAASCEPKTVSVSTGVPATQTASRLPVQSEALKLIPSTLSSVSVFHPTQGMVWQWQLNTPVDTSIQAQIYDIDLFDNSAQVVSVLHQKGAKVICYTSVGTREDWRADADQFQAGVIGKNDSGWQGEHWLDIRQIAVLAPVILARMDLCKAKGFDGLEPDNIDAYTNDTGFPLTYDDQLKYNRWLSQQAHARGLSIGLKNDGSQAAALFHEFDWALMEDCFVYSECELMKSFLAAGKQVVDTEYTDTGITLDRVCPQAKKLGMDVIFKERDLTSFRKICP